MSLAAARIHSNDFNMRALIVEDSFEDLLNLRTLLQRIPEMEIVAEASTLSAARQAATEHRPDLVFLDIELGMENGFDLIENLANETRVIFLTVHVNYGAKAFEVNAVDYLVKPITEERLLGALARLRSPGSSPLTQVMVYRAGGQRNQLALEAVAAIKADRDYSIVLCGSREYLDSRRFSEWVQLLEGKGFAQLDRSTLLRLDLVLSWLPYRPGFALRFRNSSLELKIGRAAAQRFEELMGNP
jgi:two-component system LytT family response regulator